MAITPDQPFPKGPGDAIRSKDWNDVVTEAQRLDGAKLNRAGDAVTGSLTVAGALGVKTAAPKAPLHVVGPALVSDGDGTAVPNNSMASGSLTIGSITKSFGGGTNWNANTAGLLLETADHTEIAIHDAGTRVASVVHYQGAAANTLTVGRDMGWGAISRLVLNGNVGVGVPAPELKLDVGDRIRLRQGPSGDAGTYLSQSTGGDRAFMGMWGNDLVGFWGKPAGWSLMVDVNTGNVGVRTNPSAPPYALTVNGDVYLGSGRVRDQRILVQANGFDHIQTTTLALVPIPGLSATIVNHHSYSVYALILVTLNGVQSMGTMPAAGLFRLDFDGIQWNSTRQEFHNSGWELRTVVMTTLGLIPPGTHTLTAQWGTSNPASVLHACWYGDFRSLHVIEL